MSIRCVRPENTGTPRAPAASAPPSAPPRVRVSQHIGMARANLTRRPAPGVPSTPLSIFYISQQRSRQLPPYKPATSPPPPCVQNMRPIALPSARSSSSHHRRSAAAAPCECPSPPRQQPGYLARARCSQAAPSTACGAVTASPSHPANPPNPHRRVERARHPSPRK